MTIGAERRTASRCCDFSRLNCCVHDQGRQQSNARHQRCCVDGCRRIAQDQKRAGIRLEEVAQSWVVEKRANSKSGALRDLITGEDTAR